MTTEKKRLRVGILFGGRSGEHEVSLISAASVIQALDPAKYEVMPIGITKDGRWLAGTAAQFSLTNGASRRFEREWRNLAITSLPVPLSP